MVLPAGVYVYKNRCRNMNNPNIVRLRIMWKKIHFFMICT